MRERERRLVRYIVCLCAHIMKRVCERDSLCDKERV